MSKILFKVVPIELMGPKRQICHDLGMLRVELYVFGVAESKPGVEISPLGLDFDITSQNWKS